MMSYRAWRRMMLRAMMPRMMWAWLAPGYARLGPGLQGRFAGARDRPRNPRARFARKLERAAQSPRETPARARALIPYDTTAATSGQRRESEAETGERSGGARSAQQRGASRSSPRGQGGQSAAEARASESSSEKS